MFSKLFLISSLRDAVPTKPTIVLFLQYSIPKFPRSNFSNRLNSVGVNQNVLTEYCTGLFQKLDTLDILNC